VSSRLYWLLATLLTAVVVHLSFVLFAPKLVMAERLQAIRAAVGDTSLKVLTPGQTLRLIGEEGEGLVHALCFYDLDNGPVMVTAVIPPSYWSISIYSASGDNFYSFNDRQADVGRLAILLRRDRTVVAEVDDGVGSEAPSGDTLEVFPPEPRGIVVFRALAGEAADRAGTAAELARSTCAPSRN